ncbi:MAG TPA: ribosomal-protein-alanine N-acetyltransferase [Deltaproteobacteria bacterium]|nr:ribosomal-protein-alanine N-acetyltransferase [Deltaproteobacteria bacterium]
MTLNGLPKYTPAEGEIRDMTTDDLDAVLAIERSAYVTPWSREMFRSELFFDACVNRVALRETEVVGYSCFALVVDEAHLRNITVGRRWRHRGVAKALLHDMIRIALEQGAVFATLEVRPSNTVAVELYNRFGFNVTGVRPRYYGDTGEDALIMWADLRNNDYGRTGRESDYYGTDAKT